MLSLTEQESSKGVVCHSSGNHAAAVALAAKIRGVPAHIVVPHNTPRVKTDAVKAYGGASLEAGDLDTLVRRPFLVTAHHV